MDEYEYTDVPSNIEAERYVLAAMMDQPQAVEDVCEILVPEDFYRPAHQMIFMAIVSMFAASEPCTPITLSAWLQRDGIKPRQYGGIDGDMYLANLYGLPVPGPMGAAHARIVWDCAVRRKIREAAIRMQQQALTLDHSPDAIIGEAQKVIAGLGRQAQPSRQDAIAFDKFLGLDNTRTAPVIPGLIDHEDRVVIVGVEGQGKSMLAQQVAFAGGAGIHPFIWTQQITPVRSLIMDLENPKGMLQRRWRRFGDVAARYPGWHPANVKLWTAPGGVNLELATDQFRLSEQVREVRPDLLIVGPVGKMIVEREHGEHLHSLIMNWCDQMRERYGCAVWVEHHAPLRTGPGKRELRPRGSGKWSSWPEFGIALAPSRDHLVLERFRGDREEGRTWPESIARNNTPGGWPWTPTYPRNTFMDPMSEPS